jgi:hypothetical protein
MAAAAEDRYRTAVAELGSEMRWYQTSRDLLYAAVVAAVDGVAVSEILTRGARLGETLPRTHDLHLISQSVAAVSAAGSVDTEAFVTTSDASADALRAATRTKRARRIAGAVVAACPAASSPERIVTLHKLWNDRHRVLTTGLDVILAAITEVSGSEPHAALARAESADQQLAEAGYQGEWEVARILAVDSPISTVPRFLRLADELRGRRRKPLTDRRHIIAIAALAHHTPEELAGLVRARIDAIRAERIRPDASGAVTLAALLTLGASVPAGHRLHNVFHGFVLREHYTASYRDATAD